jgi:hypothetical protein
MESISELISGSSKLAPASQLNNEYSSAMPGANMTYGVRLYTMAELMAQEFPEELWVVDGLIPEGITVMSAQPASYKTWLLLAIATNVADGTSLFGQFATEQSGVLMIDEENAARLLQQRLGLLDSTRDLPIYFMVEQDFKLDSKHINNVIRICKDNDIGLITLDSLVRIHRANENDAVQMAEVFASLRRFTKVGINVLVTHHHRKAKSESQSQNMRGSSDILAAVDCHIAVTRDDNNRLLLTQTKVRIAAEHDPVEIEVVADKELVTFKYTGTAKPSEGKRAKTIAAILNVLYSQSEMNQTELRLALEDVGCKVNAKTLRDYLEKMLEDDQIIVMAGRGSEKRYQVNNYHPLDVVG